MLTDKSSELPHGVRQALLEVLTGGNHLASVLIGRLGCDPKVFPVYETPVDQAEVLLKGDNWDLWIAWRSIMRLRESLREVGIYE